MAVAQGALLGGDLAVAPVNVVALLQAVGRAPGIIVRRHDAAAGHFESVHDHKPPGGNDFRMVSKATGRLVRKVNSATSLRPEFSFPRGMVSSVEESITRSMESISHSTSWVASLSL
jgi:hypothetical protein